MDPPGWKKQPNEGRRYFLETGGLGIGRVLGGSSQDGRKWLGSPPFISHGRGT